MIILCTPESVRRPWIYFEAGAATLLDKKVGPICFTGQKVGKLPSPLNYIRSQAIDCSDDETFEQYFKKFLEIIAHHIDEPVPTIDIINSDFYRSIKSEKPEKISTKREMNVSSGGNLNQEYSDKELRVIQHMSKTIFSPMLGLLQSDQDFFRRGYNIEYFYMMQQTKKRNIRNPIVNPNSLLKTIIHHPDPILREYLDEIKELSDEYDTCSERLVIINKDIFEKKNLIWEDFVKLCDKLNAPQSSLPNSQDYVSLLALAIADPNDLGDSYQMWDFYSTHKDDIRSFILNSPLEKTAREYVALRKKFCKFSNHFIEVLTNLKNDWIRTYLFLEPDL